MAISDFPIRYESWFTPLAWPLGLGPRGARVRIEGGSIQVRMGWGFRADIPLSAVRAAELDTGGVSGWGVHGFGGRWLVNGSSQGLVRLEIDPRVRARAVLLPVRLGVLRVSLEDPQGFLAALGRVN